MQPRRIASLLASGTEILYALGLGDRVVAVSHECDFPAEVAGKPRVTFTHVDAQASSGEIDTQVRERTAAGEALYEIDVEQLAALEPELIVTQSQCDVCAVRYADVVDAVQNDPRLKNTQVVDLNPTTLGGILDDVRRVAAAADVPDAGERVVGQLEARIAAVRSRAEHLPPKERPRVACIEWIEPLMLAANWMPELLELCGAAETPVKKGAHSTETPWEVFIEFAPQTIVFMPCGFPLAQALREWRQLAARTDWAEIPSVRQVRLWAVDGNAYFNRSGPRMIDSLEILAHLIHPDLFPQPSCVADPARVWQRLDR